VTVIGGAEVLHRPTHADLIEPAQSSALSTKTAGLDAIVVPAARRAKNLAASIELARDTGAHLVILYSRYASRADIRALLAVKNLATVTAVKIPEAYSHWRLNEFETTRWVRDGPGKSVCGTRNSDLSVKRNIGLLLARMAGWKNIFFMDDDIRNVSADALVRTVSLLGTRGDGYHTAGMSVKDYPDNSVVCHARRRVGDFQDVFVSGSALAVDCTAPFAFFPDIYNEDWLFFYGDAATGKLATPGSLAEQLPYDPFANPRRAASEEFGDVIAEGLYALLHENLGPEAANRDFWEQFLEDRNRILYEIGKHLAAAPHEMQAKMLKAIVTAWETLVAITPKMCVDYIAAWQWDLERWEKLLANLPAASSIVEALRELGLG
jgi:glycosyltransferase involved in cell wall biosynthesis